MFPVNTIKNPVAYFNELGGLHDARIIAVSWNKGEKTLRISVDDLNSNFLNLPEYQGTRQVDILFTGVRRLDLNIQIFEASFSIYDLEIKKNEKHYCVDIRCSPGGNFNFQCKSVKVYDI